MNGEVMMKQCPKCSNHETVSTVTCVECGFVWNNEDGRLSKNKFADRELITNHELEFNSQMSHYDGYDTDELRLSLFELLLKASAGYRNSHTEEGFMGMFDLLKKDRTLNSKGRKFILSIAYKHSNNKADIFCYIDRFRKG